jgi:CRP/FNR family cyclic AMP-dependent transcriptional regulator
MESQREEAVDMYFPQRDLFHGMETVFVKAIMDLAEKADFQSGDILFHEGEPADHLYILVKGGVKLTLGENGHVVYNVSHGGETFGWSSLVGREKYSASAECQKSTRVFKVNVNALQGILDSDPSNGLVLYRRLAGVLGERLIQSYKNALDASSPEEACSYGATYLSQPDAP